MGRHPSRRHVAPDDAPIGPRIRQRRRELELTQADLAAPEYTKSFISQLEGGFADPSLDTLRFLSRRLRMSLSTIAGDTADQRLAGVEGLLQWGREAAHESNPALARRVLEAASEIAALAGWSEQRAEAALLLADVEIGAGNLDRAETLISEAGTLSASLGSWMQIRKELGVGLLALRRRDGRVAAAAFQRALSLGRRSPRYPDLAARALIGMAVAATQMADLKQARRRLHSAVTLAGRARLDGLHANALIRLGMVLSLEGAHADAIDHLQRAVDLLERGGDGGFHLEALLALGHAHLVTGDSASAGRAAEDASAVADALDDPAARARAAAMRGRALFAQGRTADAVPMLAEAIGHLISGDAASELAEAARVLGEHYQSRGDHDLATRYLGIAAEAAKSAGEGPSRLVNLRF